MEFRSYIAAALPLLLVACGASAKGLEGRINRTPLGTAQAAQHKQLVQEGDALWEGRADRAKLEGAIAKWDAATKIKDDDAESYVKLARAAYLLADGWMFFDRETSPAAETAFLKKHEQGFAYAERGLAAISRDYEKRRAAGTKVEDAIKVVGRNGVPLIYWYATNLGKWAKAKGFTTILANKDKIFKIVSRVHELAPDYFYGASDRYFGAFYSVAPKFAGGDLQKSYDHFTASLKTAPNYLGTYVLIAELYTTKEDKQVGVSPSPEKFTEFLNTVINAQPCQEGSTSMAPCIMKGLEPESIIEKKKAADLLKRKNDFF